MSFTARLRQKADCAKYSAKKSHKHNGEMIDKAGETRALANGNNAQYATKTVSAAVTDKRRRMEQPRVSDPRGVYR
jgi:hypothetical protein